MIDFQLRYTLVSFYSSLFFSSSDDSRVMSITNNIMEGKRESHFLLFDKSEVSYVYY